MFTLILYLQLTIQMEVHMRSGSMRCFGEPRIIDIPCCHLPNSGNKQQPTGQPVLCTHSVSETLKAKTPATQLFWMSYNVQYLSSLTGADQICISFQKKRRIQHKIFNFLSYRVMGVPRVFIHEASWIKKKKKKTGAHCRKLVQCTYSSQQTPITWIYYSAPEGNTAHSRPLQS